ncbi:MAG: hypothetical protein KBC00_00700 [Candidatus Levybacteria bacterium]|nr:hypothetical protein [Candidatus Levybacteria bacterium]
MAKIKSTTQSFIEIEDIRDYTVLLKGKNACSILEVSSVNFFLLSQDEQNARIYGYMSLLNSLSFAIQIVIVSKRIDLSSYVASLDHKITITQNARVAEHLRLYKDFIQELIKEDGLLDKKTYVVIPFNALELGPTSGGNKKTHEMRITEAIATKRTNVMTQIERIGLSSRVIKAEELGRVFFELFNQTTMNVDFSTNDVKNIIV